ncbi:MAG: hypothetical protein ACOC3H_02130 [bacterium]
MARSRRRRPKPPNRLARHTAPMHIFVAGVLTIVAFLLQDNLVVRVGQVLLFALLATLAGKRIQWGYFAIIVGSITLFNLLTPVGRVLLEIGPLTVTMGALRQGLLKGFAIAGLVFISLFAVRPELKLPGTFGGLLGRVFFYFERVLDTRRRVSAGHLVSSVDEILMDLYPPGSEHGSGAGAPESPAHETDVLGAVVMIALVLGNVALAIVY